MNRILLIALLAAGCAGDGGTDAGLPDGVLDGDGMTEEHIPDGYNGADEAGDEGSACPVDPCIMIDAFPFEHSSDTSR